MFPVTTTAAPPTEPHCQVVCGPQPSRPVSPAIEIFLLRPQPLRPTRTSEFIKPITRMRNIYFIVCCYQELCKLFAIFSPNMSRSTDSAHKNCRDETEEKPGSAWRPFEEGGNSLGCSTNWVASLGLIRKYQITK